MRCQDAEDALLDRLDGTPPADAAALDLHLAECSRCAAFAASVLATDAELARAVHVPTPSPQIRVNLAARIRADKRRARRDYVPDIVHFASCAAATAACALIVPTHVVQITGVGVMTALSSYVVLASARELFDAVD